MSETAISNTGRTWGDPERVERLKRLWAEGFSAGDIAIMLEDVSRNAVIGKIHRLGIQSAAGDRVSRPRLDSRFRTTAPANMQMRNMPRPTRHEINRSKNIAVRMQVAPAPKSVPAPILGKITIAELENWMCRYITGDVRAGNYSYCGNEQVEGSSYCEDCHDRVHAGGSNLRPIGLPRSVLEQAA